MKVRESNLNIILYAMLFIIGTVFGSFLTLATYRIPLNQDITHKRSYCPKCNHRLEFLDLIPIFSFIFLKGRCRYCKSKISPRYFIIEILCGIVFMLMGFYLNINIYNFTIFKEISFFIGALFIVFMFLIAGIDKEKNYIDDRVLIYGLLITLIDMIYNYFVYRCNFNRLKFVFYILIISLIVLINIYMAKKKPKVKYIPNLLIYLVIITLFFNEYITLGTIIIGLLIITIISYFENKPIKKSNIPYVFYFSISNILMLIIVTFIQVVNI